ncbi:MAG TPA: ABC transporter ATP-binding protein [Candidatus Binatia bacterium]|nr:ABC transporter ATP-binding protein [Candidatus Binatia bacterium]
MNAIEVRNVSKQFRIPHERHTTLAERLLAAFRPNEVEVLDALSDVTVDVPRGSFVGIIGANGSGKSTLLKIMAGLLVPDEGQVRVHGTLVPLLELGLGFQQELSVRENVELYGTVLGYSRATMARRIEEVVAFAGLERFQDAKLKSLSSGMMVRLAFSTALRADAEIMLLDEVLAVGDARFQRKCLEVFAGLKRQRKTIVLVSHDVGSVQRFCEHVYWLDKGRLVMAGDAAEVVHTYLAVAQAVGGGASPLESDGETEHRWGDGSIRFTEVALTDDEGRAVTQVTPWARLVVRACFVASAPVENPVIGFMVWLGGQLVYATNTQLLGVETGRLAPGDRRRIEVRFTAALVDGRYTVTLAAVDQMLDAAYDWVNHATAFTVVGARCVDGVADLGAELDYAAESRDVHAVPGGGRRR